MSPGPRRPTSDGIAYAAVASGAYASAATALLFLGLDAARGTPLFTPSLMGSVVFHGQAPEAVTGVRLELVALYSLVHFAAFALAGTVATLATARSSGLRAHPVRLAGAIFAALTVAVLGADRLLFPGLVGQLGLGALIAANTLASVVMTRFISSVVGAVPAPAPAPSRVLRGR